MAVNNSHTAVAIASTESVESGMTDDRYCRHCREIALAFDPAVNQARCRSCGELA